MKYEEKEPWPGGRFYHITVPLCHEEKHHRLLISGGTGGFGVTKDDLWLLDPHSGKMEKVRK